MNEEKLLKKRWIELGAICGLIYTIFYQLLIFVPLPRAIQVTLMSAKGSMIGIAAVGCYYFFIIHRKTITLQIAMVAQIIAGVLVTTMNLVQKAIVISITEETERVTGWALKAIDNIQLSLDVNWDIYIFLGSIMFALNMFRHPKFGKIFATSGIVICLIHISLNILTFPKPPKDAGYFDIGPVFGLWGLAVYMNILIHLKWVKNKLGASELN